MQPIVHVSVTFFIVWPETRLSLLIDLGGGAEFQKLALC